MQEEVIEEDWFSLGRGTALSSVSVATIPCVCRVRPTHIF